MKIINQPHMSRLGDKLKELLSQNAQYKFQTFYFIVAYVKKTGVVHLQTPIQEFRASGGLVKAIVGIDQRNTSVQALRLLFSLCDELWVCHNEGLIHTFHPKVYAFEKSGEKAIVFVGSSNLTEGGLYTNYETDSYFEYDLTDSAQAKTFSEFKLMFEAYSKPSKLTKKLTSELVEVLYKRRYLSDESKGSTIPKTRVSLNKQAPIFGTRSFHAPSVRKSAARQAKVRTEGKLLWRKKELPPSDVQVVKKGTAPTGGLRLTQSDWKVEGKSIDQTTYFRDNLFGEFEWKLVKPSPKAEVAKVLFRLKILGKDLGLHRLLIRHKPSGEAGQHNYTTSISWGELSRRIRKSSLIGKSLHIYGPPKGQKEPFFIEIK